MFQKDRYYEKNIFLLLFLIILTFNSISYSEDKTSEDITSETDEMLFFIGKLRSLVYADNIDYSKYVKNFDLLKIPYKISYDEKNLYDFKKTLLNWQSWIQLPVGVA